MTGEEDWLAPLRAKFAVRLTAERDTFRALQSSGDTAQLIDRAHKLAGLAGMMGAPAVGDAAFRLEETARGGADYDTDLAALIAAIEHAIG